MRKPERRRITPAHRLFGARLKDIMAKRGLTNRALARKLLKLGASKHIEVIIATWRRGKRLPAIRYRLMLCQALGVKYNVLCANMPITAVCDGVVLRKAVMPLVHCRRCKARVPQVQQLQTSGNLKWSTILYCDACRPIVRADNQWRRRQHWASIPVARELLERHHIYKFSQYRAWQDRPASMPTTPRRVYGSWNIIAPLTIPIRDVEYVILALHNVGLHYRQIAKVVGRCAERVRCMKNEMLKVEAINFANIRRPRKFSNRRVTMLSRLVAGQRL